MSTTDWKSQLGKLSGQASETPTTGKPLAQPSTPLTKTVPAGPKRQSEPVVIRFEKRGGKPTTIVSRVEGNQEAVGALAGKLRSCVGQVARSGTMKS